MELKQLEFKAEVKDIEKNLVYLKIAAFNNMDSHCDIVRDTAFNRTIKNNFHNIKHVLEHCHDFEYIVGVPKQFDVKSDGCYVESAINVNVAKGEYAMAQFKFFAENGMNIDQSIGYQVVKTQKNDELIAEAIKKFGEYYPYIKDQVGRDITELKLFEYSNVFRGSNSEANRVMIKGDLDLNSMIYSVLTEDFTIEKLENMKTLLQQHTKGTQSDPLIVPVSNKQFAEILTKNQTIKLF